jgi:hypothetical protein
VLSGTATAISARMPLDIPSGVTTVVTTVTAGASNAAQVTILRGALGLYSQNGLGWGPGAIRDSARRLNTPEHSAHRGDTVRIATNAGTAARIYVGARPAVIVAASADEIRFRIPDAAPVGCYVPVYGIAGLWVSNTVTVSISDRGDVCAPEPYWPSSGWQAHRLAVMIASRSPALDEMSAEFAEKAPGTPPGPLLLAPPAGTCANYFTETDSAVFLSEMSPYSRGLDAGKALAVIRKQYRKMAPAYGRPGIYRGTLGGAPLPPFFGGEDARAQIPGGADVAAFSVPIATPEPLESINTLQLAEIDRRTGATILWKPGDGSLLIVAVAAQREAEASAICVCLANAREGVFKIPPAMLRHFPVANGQLRLLYQSSLPNVMSNLGSLDSILTLSIYGQTVKTSFR